VRLRSHNDLPFSDTIAAFIRPTWRYDFPWRH
jgi:hypothetical protein